MTTFWKIVTTVFLLDFLLREKATKVKKEKKNKKKRERGKKWKRDIKTRIINQRMLFPL